MPGGEKVVSLVHWVLTTERADSTWMVLRQLNEGIQMQIWR